MVCRTGESDCGGRKINKDKRQETRIRCQESSRYEVGRRCGPLAITDFDRERQGGEGKKTKDERRKKYNLLREGDCSGRQGENHYLLTDDATGALYSGLHRLECSYRTLNTGFILLGLWAISSAHRLSVKVY